MKTKKELIVELVVTGWNDKENASMEINVEYFNMLTKASIVRLHKKWFDYLNGMRLIP